MSANHHFTATDYDDALLRLVDLAVNNNAIAIAINAGGTGYTVGDTLTVSGGTVVASLTLTLEVTSVAAGVIDGIRILDCGAYSSNPANPVAVTGGTGGDDATFNMTFSTFNWTLNRNVASSTSILDIIGIQTGSGGTVTFEREIQLQGQGLGGADEIFIGFLELRDTAAGSFNWMLGGFTGFGSGLTWENQPGFSFVEPNEIPAFIGLAGASIECWFHVSPRHLAGVCRMGTTYNNFIAGLMNPYATPAEFPYPLYIGGSTGKWNQVFTESGASQSGLCDPIASTATGGNARGSAGFRNTAGVWVEVQNWDWTGSTRTRRDTRGCYPCGSILGGASFMPIEDRFVGGSTENTWEGTIPRSGVGAQAVNLFPTPDTGGDLTQLYPTYIWERAPSFSIFGELPDVFWGSASGGLVTEDRVFVNGEAYRFFQQGNRTEPFAFVALREEA